MTQIKMSKKNREHYSLIMYNKQYDSLSENEKENVTHQYAAEHCLFTREDERRIMIQEEYGNSSLPRWFKSMY